MKNINSPIFNRTKNHLNVHYEPSPKPLLLRRNPVNSSNVRWVPKLMKNSKHKVETVVLTSPYLAKIHSSLIERFGGPALLIQGRKNTGYEIDIVRTCPKKRLLCDRSKSPWKLDFFLSHLRKVLFVLKDAFFRVSDIKNLLKIPTVWKSKPFLLLCMATIWMKPNLNWLLRNNCKPKKVHIVNLIDT